MGAKDPADAEGVSAVAEHIGRVAPESAAGGEHCHRIRIVFEVREIHNGVGVECRGGCSGGSRRECHSALAVQCDRPDGRVLIAVAVSVHRDHVEAGAGGGVGGGPCRHPGDRHSSHWRIERKASK